MKTGKSKVSFIFQFASVEVIITTIQDHFSFQVKKYLKRKEILVLVVCLVSYVCGLPNVTQVLASSFIYSTNIIYM